MWNTCLTLYQALLFDARRISFSPSAVLDPDVFLPDPEEQLFGFDNFFIQILKDLWFLPLKPLPQLPLGDSFVIWVRDYRLAISFNKFG